VVLIRKFAAISAAIVKGKESTVMGLIRGTAVVLSVLSTFALVGGAAPAASAAPAAAAAAGGGGPGLSYGPRDGMHVVVTGNAESGLAAEIYDGSTFVTKRGMDGPADLTVLPITTTGPDLLGTPAGQLPWQGPVEAGVGPVAGTYAPATLPDGTSAIHWAQPAEPANTWIYVVPSGVVQGNTYTASITLQGSGTVYLDFFDGQQDHTTTAVKLSGAPHTFSLGQIPIPAGTQTAAPRLQIEQAAGSGPVDLYATHATMHQVVVPSPGPGNQLLNRYRTVRYDPRSQTLTLSDAVNTVGPATVSRTETYRFVNPEVIDSTIGVSATSPVELWYSPYTDFPASWQPMSVSGPTTSLDTASSPIPVLGASNGRYIYGVASGATLDYPLPGYSAPHITITGSRLAAPQIGTQANPVTLAAGVHQMWRTVFFRAAPTTYGLELGGEIAMAEALGFNRDNSPGIGSGDSLPAGTGSSLPASALPSLASSDLGLISRATAYWLRLRTTAGAVSVTPSLHYAPYSWMRDSFWTDMGLSDTPMGARTETQLMNEFTAQTTADGHVPLTVAGINFFFYDESGLLYLIRMYRDSKLLHLPVANIAVAEKVLGFISSHQVQDGAFTTAPGGQTYGSWLDGYLYPADGVDAYDQGLYVVALMAAQRLGVPVSDQAIAQAQARYGQLYDSQLGYMRWLSTTTDKSPDVLAGDALSLYLFNKPLLSDQVVTSTLSAQTWTPYGMKVLAAADGSYLPADQFASWASGVSGDPGGTYQNGGSWFLYEYLAEYAALRQGDGQAADLMARSAADEVAVTPMFKEFKLTAPNSGYPYPLGSSELGRQGYGWNAAYVAFARSLQQLSKTGQA
jgi:hypothetical protein